jgi:hypothetical protein
VPQPTCSVCGATLRDGACPNGHPQRAARREGSSRRRRLFPLILLILIVGGIAYTTLVWVPRNQAAELMGPSSREFSESVEAYRGAAGALPPGATDPGVLADLANTAVAATGPAREKLSDASLALSERTPLDLPIISSREPLREAIALRARMTDFYTAALQAISGLERAASYLAQAGAVLPALANLEEALVTADLNAPGVALDSAIPVSDQLITDLQALTAPDELSGLHQSLLTIAQRIRDGLETLVTFKGGQAGKPVVAATLKSARDEIAAFRQTFGTAPRRARGGGLGPLLDEVDALVVEITGRLSALRTVHSLDGITLPGEPTD